MVVFYNKLHTRKNSLTFPFPIEFPMNKKNVLDIWQDETLHYSLSIVDRISEWYYNVIMSTLSTNLYVQILDKLIYYELYTWKWFEKYNEKLLYIPNSVSFTVVVYFNVCSFKYLISYILIYTLVNNTHC